jgi:hypothetical protein
MPQTTFVPTPITLQVPELSKQTALGSRLEPRCRSDSFMRGLGARTADPLWMLTRQWQVGEFIGEDAGSPIDIEVQYVTCPINKIQ